MVESSDNMNEEISKKNKKITGLIILISILLIVGAFFLGQFLGKNKSDKKNTKNDSKKQITSNNNIYIDYSNEGIIVYLEKNNNKEILMKPSKNYHYLFRNNILYYYDDAPRDENDNYINNTIILNYIDVNTKKKVENIKIYEKDAESILSLKDIIDDDVYYAYSVCTKEIDDNCVKLDRIVKKYNLKSKNSSLISKREGVIFKSNRLNHPNIIINNKDIYIDAYISTEEDLFKREIYKVDENKKETTIAKGDGAVYMIDIINNKLYYRDDESIYYFDLELQKINEIYENTNLGGCTNVNNKIVCTIKKTNSYNIKSLIIIDNNNIKTIDIELSKDLLNKHSILVDFSPVDINSCENSIRLTVYGWDKRISININELKNNKYTITEKNIVNLANNSFEYDKFDNIYYKNRYE